METFATYRLNNNKIEYSLPRLDHRSKPRRDQVQRRHETTRGPMPARPQGRLQPERHPRRDLEHRVSR